MNGHFQRLAFSSVPVVQRACACGGTCAHCRGQDDEAERIQAKLRIGPPGDRYEREADRIAWQVMHIPETAARQHGGRGSPTRRDGERDVQAPAAPQELGLSAGRPLDASTRAFMEPRFGCDFSHVRVHTGDRAADSARALDARAYTAGNQIVFAAGQYLPESSEGRTLLAHELTHVVQQGAAGPLSPPPREPLSMRMASASLGIQRRTFGIAGACWFANCQDQLQNFQMIPEDGPPGFHPSGSGSSFRVDDIDGFWFKYHTPKTEWFKIPDLGTGQVTCTEDERAPSIRPAAIVPFATAGWTDDDIHTPNPY